ncbi:hypothetical protein XENTR_v10004235 [Xenopus tropicalis]|nr:hypothetical protein XENTR_v10004235 [Xenopus tropicalis]
MEGPGSNSSIYLGPLSHTEKPQREKAQIRLFIRQIISLHNIRHRRKPSITIRLENSIIFYGEINFFF